MATKKECKYCKITDKMHYEAERSIRDNQRIHIQIIRHFSVENLYYLRVKPDRMTGETIKIEYCPVCGRKLEEKN